VTHYVRQPDALGELSVDDHAVIEASAGTGKTYMLERLVAHLLLDDEDLRLSEILVVTFTERATGELRERIRGMLERFRRGPGDLVAEEAGGDCWEIDEAAKERLGRALSWFGRVSIHTIHGFCRRVLGEHSFAHDRLFDPEHVERDELFDGAFTRALRERFAENPELVPYLQAWRGRLGHSLDRLERRLARLTRETGELRCNFDPAQLGERVRCLPPPPGTAFVEDFTDELEDRGLHHNSVRSLTKRI